MCLKRQPPVVAERSKFYSSWWTTSSRNGHNCYRSINPSSWIEFQDRNGCLRRIRSGGYEARPGIKLEQWFKDTGFVNIHVERFVIISTASGKKIHTILSVSLPCCQAKQWTKEEVIVASQARADGRKHNIHSMFDFYVVHGQRPEN
ncbi:hypothetical protein VTN31DRAFT_3801 [Thermomyces dupontii]|uniref:uncharacterized protein n=1 Tax=Talaromyces thermophilus TaxID=28565 RepID=UPI0037421028